MNQNWTLFYRRLKHLITQSQWSLSHCTVLYRTVLYCTVLHCTYTIAGVKLKLWLDRINRATNTTKTRDWPHVSSLKCRGTYTDSIFYRRRRLRTFLQTALYTWVSYVYVRAISVCEACKWIDIKLTEGPPLSHGRVRLYTSNQSHKLTNKLTDLAACGERLLLLIIGRRAAKLIHEGPEFRRCETSFFGHAFLPYKLSGFMWTHQILSDYFSAYLFRRWTSGKNVALNVGKLSIVKVGKFKSVEGL